MKATFLKYNKPLLTVMIQCATPDEIIRTIIDATYEGAEAFGIQLCCLKKEYRTEEHLRNIFEMCEGKPIYITSYRYHESKDMSDNECAELLLLGLRCGATLCDVMGDIFHPEHNEITYDKEAIEKQIKLIEKIHELGGEVIMSTHLHAYYEEDDIFKFANEHLRRGADITKIVSFAQNEEQLMSDIIITRNLCKKIEKPCLFLANGRKSKLLRLIGPVLGVCMYLCVLRHDPADAREQPTLRAIKKIRDNMNFML